MNLGRRANISEGSVMGDELCEKYTPRSNNSDEQS
jgi:hypothetical protein